VLSAVRSIDEKLRQNLSRQEWLQRIECRLPVLAPGASDGQWQSGFEVLLLGAWMAGQLAQDFRRLAVAARGQQGKLLMVPGASLQRVRRSRRHGSKLFCGACGLTVGQVAKRRVEGRQGMVGVPLQSG